MSRRVRRSRIPFFFQRSEHAIQVMNCSLDQLLNLHSGIPRNIRFCPRLP